jgi:hypothetical protein
LTAAARRTGSRNELSADARLYAHLPACAALEPDAAVHVAPGAVPDAALPGADWHEARPDAGSRVAPGPVALHAAWVRLPEHAVAAGRRRLRQDAVARAAHAGLPAGHARLPVHAVPRRRLRQGARYVLPAVRAELRLADAVRRSPELRSDATAPRLAASERRHSVLLHPEPLHSAHDPLAPHCRAQERLVEASR